MPAIKPDWYCIVNPHAGSGKTMDEWRIAEKKFTELSVPYKTTLTNYKFHATVLAYEAALHGYRKILAVGGDGSVHEVLAGIMQYVDEKEVPAEEFTLAVVPIGSGNDWIKTNNVPHDTEKVVEMIAAGSFGKMDIVRVETSEGRSYMANVGGTGFDSHVCERVNAQKERGKRSSRIYANALVHTILSFHRFINHVKVTADGRDVFDGTCYSVALGNGPYSGGGMRQVPLAVNDDGLLDYMVVPKLPLVTIVKEVGRLYNGTANESPYLISGKCRELVISGDDLVEVDGEIKGNLPLKVSMTGSKINVLKGA